MKIIAKEPAFESINSIFQSLAPSFSGLSYHAYFMQRRLLFALTSIYLTNYPVLQVYLIIALSLTNCCSILGCMPFDTPSLPRILLRILHIFNNMLLPTVDWDIFGDCWYCDERDNSAQVRPGMDHRLHSHLEHSSQHGYYGKYQRTHGVSFHMHPKVLPKRRQGQETTWSGRH
jgi:hypothetical protein